MRTKFSGILTLLLALVVQLTFAQEKTISGTVTDNTGLPLPGVNIVVKGTTNGTQSDFDGNYSIQASVGQTLVYSYVGFKTTERPVTAATSNISFQMEEDAQALEEVVVTGYGIAREKKALGYAVSTINAEEIENKPEADVVRSLTGKVAGVQITATGGATGSGTNFIIRSKSSINGDNQPLFVVDGVPFDASTNQQTGFDGGNSITNSRFLDLDPNNIETVRILKGLSAAVLYGQQGRNGVVLITTKSGSKKDLNKKFEVSVASSVYAVEIANFADYQNTYGQGSDNTPNPGFVGNWGGRFDDNLTIAHPLSNEFGDVFPQFDGLEIPYTAAEDNVFDFFRTGLGQSMSVNVAGSPGDGGNSRFNVNFGYATEDGYIRNNGLTRYNLSLGGSTQLSNKFSFNATANFSNLRTNTPPIAANNAFGSISVFTRTLFIPRNLDLGNLPFENPLDNSSVYYRSDQTNPYWLLNYAGTEQKTNRFYGQFSTNYQISDVASLSYRFGLDTYTENQEFRVSRGANDDATNPAGAFGAYVDAYREGYLRTTSGTNFIFDHNLSFSLSNIDISDKLNFSSSIGFNARRDTYEQFGLVSIGQVVFNFANHNNFSRPDGIPEFAQNTDPITGGRNLDFRTERNILGAFGEMILDYDNFLYLTISGRNDWASTVESENRSLFYPGVSLSFTPTSLDGFGSSEGIGLLKFRGSFGTSARFPGVYGTRLALSSNPLAFTDAQGNAVVTNTLPTIRPNRDLQPELQQEIEAGIEAELFKRRVTVDATVYKRIITDQIVLRPLATSTGFSFINDNIAESQIEGLELGVNFSPIQNENFTWSVRTNFTAYENEVTDLGGIEPFAFAGFTGLGNYASEGEALGVIKGSYATRIDPTNATEENPLGLGVEGRLLINPNDGKIINSDDLGLDIETVGDPNPDWNSTVINSFTYKGLTLSAQVEYQHGGDIYSQTANQYYRRGVTTVNVDNREGSFIIPGILANPGTGEPLTDGNGDFIENTIQIGANDVYFINLVDPTGQGIYDASHLRLREVSLTYSLDKKLLERTPFGNVSLSLAGQNLWFKAFNIPDAFNIDPEALSTGVGNGQGLDFQTGPTTKRYAFTIKATF
ncbi:SusC/RagA family TonB-linked outer membrane protein [Marinirhabdus gelatinilytica]|uniref:TonB-linked SusC/RagA family outer membrane protein n=1 Tax=Marinirhabdus gelatinilytica TaxID=1703343 RepID=A0A370QLL1_9FLAO|nr:SusC/RagA family TonB-linked outer membrane protein [Marinirhabdus gelatinilytica]RDK89267.1 TonB-linked SusC/RagA family outer membrane protein [Marinirhabdus gelatinilytica]